MYKAPYKIPNSEDSDTLPPEAKRIIIFVKDISYIGYMVRCKGNGIVWRENGTGKSFRTEDIECWCPVPKR